jgi:23S rRNA (uracil1939-C5)-methyltransferase
MQESGVLWCEVAGRCGGCPWIGRPFAAQREEKVASLIGLWREARLGEEALGALSLRSVGEGGLRDRTDLSAREGVLGLWDQAREALVPVGACPQLSPRLRAFAVSLAGDLPPVGRASLRLRVAPDGALGLWVDAANVDIKALLDEGAWLRRQRARAFVELGQRNKEVVEGEGGALRLGKPALRPWFLTWVGEERRPTPLYGPVGGFTQPGVEANRALVEEVMALAAPLGAARWLELGCGQGNFTLPLAAQAQEVRGVEVEPLAREGLARAAQEARLGERIRLAKANMHRADEAARALLEGVDAALVDPPRAGLGAFVEVLRGAAPGEGPRDLIYVSCYAESLVGDLAALCAGGLWRPVAARGVDQFPQSPHAEWIVHLRRA